MLLTGEQSPDQDASSHAVYILVKGGRHKKKKKYRNEFYMFR